MNVLLQRVERRDGVYEDDPWVHWILFEVGQLAHPLIILSTNEMEQLVQQFQKAKSKRKRAVK